MAVVQHVEVQGTDGPVDLAGVRHRLLIEDEIDRIPLNGTLMVVFGAMFTGTTMPPIFRLTNVVPRVVVGLPPVPIVVLVQPASTTSAGMSRSAG